MGTLENIVAIITGGVRNIGRATSVLFAKEGAQVVVFDIDSEDSTAIRDLNLAISQFGKKMIYIKVDVTNLTEVRSAVEETITAFGRVDVLVNIVGGGKPAGPLEDLGEKDWDWTINLNLKGTYNCTHAIIKYMKEQMKGKIINFSSIAGRSNSDVSSLPYACAKAGVLGFTRQLAHEVGPYGINVNAIAPGNTEREDKPSKWDDRPEEEKKKMLESIPLRRRARPDEIASVAVFLASENSSYITGATIDVNGGRFTI